MKKSLDKSLSRKYRQKPLHITKKLATDAYKTASKKTLEKQQKELVIELEIKLQKNHESCYKKCLIYDLIYITTNKYI